MKKIIGVFMLVLMAQWGAAWAGPRVVVVRSGKVFKDGRVDKVVLEKMLSAGMARLFDAADGAAAWKTVAGGCSRVALKVNTLSEVYATSTKPELAGFVAEGLAGAGIKRDNITIFDRGVKCGKDSDKCGERNSFKAAGYKVNRADPGVKSYEARSYGPWVKLGKSKNRFFKEIDDNDCLINMPLLKDHHIMGYTFALKNNIGLVSNPELLHSNAGVPWVAELNSYPNIRKRTRLIVGDAINAQYNGGPKDKPDFYWPENAVILATNPVAADAVALEILKKKRGEIGLEWGEMAYGGKANEYLHDLARKGLGEADPAKIEIIEIALHE